jgi:hypothetical protein
MAIDTNQFKLNINQLFQGQKTKAAFGQTPAATAGNAEQTPASPLAHEGFKADYSGFKALTPQYNAGVLPFGATKSWVV